MVFAYGFTLFVSACLLFVVQPMVGKMLLPTLGGSHSVWSICMVFFQALLLVGYAYSHLSTKHLFLRVQVTGHLLVLALPLLVLPIGISAELASTAPDRADPSFWLLGVLFITAGLPFFALSTSAPIFQKWFSQTGHRDARDPYFLYAASNAGSVAGLLLYPFLLERIATLEEQARYWQVGYFLLLVMAAFCALLLWRTQRAAASSKPKTTATSAPPSAWQDPSSPGLRRRLWWVLLAFIPSSLMLGLTSYITTDIASAPLLWIIPLGLYLLTFILVFARRPIYAPWWLGRGICLLAAALIVAFIVEVSYPPALFFGLHALLFFVVALVAHGRLAQDRPETTHLTEYFLWISVGGVLGGVFNGLIAPLLFTHIYEYPLVIALGCAVRATKPAEGARQTWKQALWVYALILLATFLIVIASGRYEWGATPGIAIAAFGVPALLVCTLIENPRAFALGLLVLLISGSFYSGYHQRPIYFERNFYGTLRVADDHEGNLRQLIDGNTVHGRQALHQRDQCDPLSYYHPRGPAGRAFTAFYDRPEHLERTGNVAVVGMGIGSLICFGRDDEHWDLFELNPLVIDVATDPKYFTILDNAPVASRDIIAGDGRLKLQAMPDDHYDIIVIDAFSSGSIPTHLLTIEALEIYLQKLSPDGLLFFNISNRILDLAPILGSITTELDIPAYLYIDDYITDADQRAGKDPSIWAFVAPRQELLEAISSLTATVALRGDSAQRPWTDSYSDIVSPILGATPRGAR